MPLELAMRKVLAREVGPNTPVLVTVDPIGDDDFVRVPKGEDIHVALTASINMTRWRKLQALFKMVSDAHPQMHDREDAVEEICMAVGHVRKSYNRRTKMAVVSRLSTSPHAFPSGEKFDRFYERCIYYITHDLLPGLPESDLKREIDEWTTPNYDASRRPR